MGTGIRRGVVQQAGDHHQSGGQQFRRIGRHRPGVPGPGRRGLRERIGAPDQTAAVEYVVGLVSRGLTLAETNPAIPALGPSTLALAARRVMLRGNAVFAIHQPRGAPLSLIPATTWDIVGGTWDPSTWIYLLEIASPLGDFERRIVPAAGVVHLRIGETAYPWQGVSPLVSAGLTATQLARIEKRLQEDATTSVAWLLPVPDGATTAQVKKLGDNIAAAAGAVVTTETTAAGHGQGPGAAPKRDLEVKRVGPAPPASAIQLRDSSALAVISAMGVSPALYSGEGGALREAYRQFLTSEVDPIATKFAEEFSAKLEIPVKFSFRKLAAADIAARARAFGTLFGSGAYSRLEAELKSGLDE